MSEFMMIFRHTPNLEHQPTPEEIQESIKQWQDWIGGIAAQGKFVSTSRLGYEGKTLQPNKVVTDGPYAEIKEIIGGNIVVKASSLEEALQMAEGCPVLQYGGNVEIRNIMPLN